MSIKHAAKSSRAVFPDGDIDAVVVDVTTGSSAGVPPADRYVLDVQHKLGRVPVGVQVIMSNKVCNVYCIRKDATTIRLKATAERAEITLRIW